MLASFGAWCELRPALSERTLKAIAALGFSGMTEVQARAIPLFLTNKDVVVDACTGSGKTLAFAVPIVELIARRETPLSKGDVGALVVTPTRELAVQVKSVVDHFASAWDLPTVLLTSGGGASGVADDISRIRAGGCALVVATPGRLLEVSDRGALNFKTLEALVLDEADRLLELGFKATLTGIIERLPKQRRTGLFSATQTDELADLLRVGTRNPVSVRVAQQAASADGHQLPENLVNTVMVCGLDQKLSQLVQFLNEHGDSKIIVYFLTCACVDYFVRILPPLLLGARKVFPLHGKAAVSARTDAYRRFVRSSNGVLLCTDVAARGLDIPAVGWIVQFDPPQDPKVFVHRIGRTARMGASGNALLLLSPVETAYTTFLGLRGVNLASTPIDESAPDVLDAVKEIARTDRVVFLKSQDAFVSYCRAYREHECSGIFRTDKLDHAALARGFGLLHMPKLGELKDKPVDYPDDPVVAIEDIPFKDPNQEKIRLEKRARLAAEAEERKAARAERKKHAREEHEERERKEQEQHQQQQRGKKKWSRDEMDELEEDSRLLKRLKKGKISDAQFDRLMGIAEEDSSSAPRGKKKKKKRH